MLNGKEFGRKQLCPNPYFLHQDMLNEVLHKM